MLLFGPWNDKGIQGPYNHIKVVCSKGLHKMRFIYNVYLSFDA